MYVSSNYMYCMSFLWNVSRTKKQICKIHKKTWTKIWGIRMRHILTVSLLPPRWRSNLRRASELAAHSPAPFSCSIEDNASSRHHSRRRMTASGPDLAVIYVTYMYTLVHTQNQQNIACDWDITRVVVNFGSYSIGFLLVKCLSIVLSCLNCLSSLNRW